MTPSSGTSRYNAASPGAWMLWSARSRITTKTKPKKAPARRPSAAFKTNPRLVGARGGFGGIHHADVARAQGGGHAGFLDVAQHGVVKLAVGIHIALEDVVVRHLGRLLGHEAGLGGVVRRQQILAALGGVVFVADALDDVGAFLLEGRLQAVHLGLDLLYRRVGRGQGRGKLGKLAAKVGELDLVLSQRLVIEHLGEGLGGSAGGQLVPDCLVTRSPWALESSS